MTIKYKKHVSQQKRGIDITTISSTAALLVLLSLLLLTLKVMTDNYVALKNRNTLVVMESPLPTDNNNKEE